MEKYNSGYHGGDGKIGYFELRGLATIDIDREEDFILAEKIIVAMMREGEFSTPQYYGDAAKEEHSEVDVETILRKDGISHNDLEDANKEIVNLDSICASYDSKISWSKKVINTESNCMTLLCQQPGEGNRLHYHPDWNEWWYIVEGEWEWEIEGVRKIVKTGDVVFMRKNRKH